VSYLEYFANDIYRILVSEPDFWNKLHVFCEGKYEDKIAKGFGDEDNEPVENKFPEVFKKHKLPEVQITVTSDAESTGQATYQST